MSLTYKDLAERWGVKYSTLRQWRHRGKLPEPDKTYGQMPVWNEETIRQLEDENGWTDRT